MINENDIPSYFLPWSWTYVYIFGSAALLTGWWGLAILTVVGFGIAIWEDYENDESNFGFDREEINEVR